MWVYMEDPHIKFELGPWPWALANEGHIKVRFGAFLHFSGQFWKKEVHMISRVINIKHIGLYVFYKHAKFWLLSSFFNAMAGL